MPNIGATELIIIAVVIVVLFGATKLPTFARSVGRSLRIFKSEAKGLQDDDGDGDEKTDADTQPAAQQPRQLAEPTTKHDASAEQRTAEQR
ncbi:MAG: twin-arginine translocase TatA/TatE family subunit [Streptosporangiales bacterium]|nr:twin-arginine translocase TatA/TatE family subunit [Streptosporangiales bacterium]